MCKALAGEVSRISQQLRELSLQRRQLLPFAQLSVVELLCAAVDTSGLGVRLNTAQLSPFFFPEGSAGPVSCPTGKTPLAQSFPLLPGQRNCSFSSSRSVACPGQRDGCPLLCGSWSPCWLRSALSAAVWGRVWQERTVALLDSPAGRAGSARGRHSWEVLDTLPG